MFKKILLILGLCALAVSSQATPIVNNSGTSSEDTLTIRVLSLDSMGYNATADSFYLYVFKSDLNSVVFRDSCAAASVTWIDTMAVSYGPLYFFRRAVSEIDGAGATGTYGGLIIAVDTDTGFITENPFSFQITAQEFDDQLTTINTNLDAVLSARTLASASYFDPTTDAVANVTTTATATSLTQLDGNAAAMDSLVSSLTGYADAQLSDREHLFTNVDEVISARSPIGDTNQFGKTDIVSSGAITTSGGAVSTVTTTTTATNLTTNNDKTGYTLSAAGIKEFHDRLGTHAEATGTPTTTTIASTSLTQADDYWNDQIIYFIDGAAAGQAARITDFVASTDLLTFTPAVIGTPVATDSFYIFGFIEAPGSGATLNAGEYTKIKDTVWLSLFSTLAGSFIDSLVLANEMATKQELASESADSVLLSTISARNTTASTWGISLSNAIRTLNPIFGTIDGATPTATGFSATELSQADDYWNNQMVMMLSGNAAGQAARISDFTAATDSVTFDPVLSTAPAQNDTFIILGLVYEAPSAGGGSDTTAIKTMMNNNWTSAAAGAGWANMLSDTTWRRIFQASPPAGSYADSMITLLRFADTTNFSTVNDHLDALGKRVLSTGTPTTTTIASTALTEVDDYWNDQMIFFLNGNADGQSARITDFVASTDLLTFTPALTTAPASGDSFYIFSFSEAPAAGADSTAIRTMLINNLDSMVNDSVRAILDTLQDGANGPDVNVIEWNGTAVATPGVAGVPEVDISHIGASALAATNLNDMMLAAYNSTANHVAADAIKLSGSAAAADNLEEAFDVDGVFLDSMEMIFGDNFWDSVADRSDSGSAAGGSDTTAIRAMLVNNLDSMRGMRVTTVFDSVGNTASRFQTGLFIFTTVDDFYNGDLIQFLETSAALDYQTSRIIDYVGASGIVEVYPPFTVTPTSADAFRLIPDEEDSTTSGGGSDTAAISAMLVSNLGLDSLAAYFDSLKSNVDDTLTAAHSSGAWTSGALTSGSFTAALGVVDTLSGTAPDTLIPYVDVDFYTLAGVYLGRLATDANGYIALGIDSGRYLVRAAHTFEESHIYPLHAGGYDTVHFFATGDTIPSSLAHADSIAVDSAVTGYDFDAGTPSGANTCVVSLWLGDIDGATGQDLYGKEVTFTLPGKHSDTCADPAVVMFNTSKTVTSDFNGMIQVELRYSSCVGETDYKMTIAGAEWSDKAWDITVPSQATYTITESDL